MEIRFAVKLALSGFAIVVALFLVLDPGMWRKSNRDWWNDMTPARRKLVIAALGAGLLQTFL